MADAHAFNIGEIVWTKLKGHPWWPTAIWELLPAKSDITEPRYRVNFLASK